MNLFVRIILWGLLMLMLKDAKSQSRIEQENVAPASTSQK
jgi:hypothetical protein